MSENRGPRRGPMGHGRMGGEKAKDFKGTMGKLIKYMSAFKIQMLFVVIFAIDELSLISSDRKYLVKQQQRFLMDW